jgi:hypothetical protein
MSFSSKPSWQNVVKQVAIALRTSIFPRNLNGGERNAYANLIDLTKKSKCNLSVSDVASISRGRQDQDSEITHMSSEEFLNLPYTFSHRIANAFNQRIADIAMHVLALLPREDILADGTILGFTITFEGKSYRFPLHSAAKTHLNIDLLIN